MKFTIFDLIKYISVQKVEWEDSFKSIYNQFMVNNFFSNFIELVEFIEEISQNELSDKQHYNILKDFLPTKSYYCKFKMKKDESVVIENICKYYKVNENIARDYNQLISDHQYKAIVKQLKINEDYE